MWGRLLFVIAVLGAVCMGTGCSTELPDEIHIVHDTPMGQLLERQLATIREYSAANGGLAMPRDWVFVPAGATITGCGEINDEVLNYCPTAHKVFVGEKAAERIYQAGGEPGYLLVLAHEYGHHLNLASNWDERGELQADCIAGVIVQFAYEHGRTADPAGDFVEAVYMLFPDDPAYGTSQERIAAFRLGARSGSIQECASV